MTTEYEQWMLARDASVSGPHGTAALVAYVPVPPEQEVRLESIPATVHRSPAGGGVFLTPTAAGAIAVDGTPVTEQVFVPLFDGTGPYITAKSITIDVFSLDDTDIELRIYDADSESRSALVGIERYPFDPQWQVDATFVPYPLEAHVPWEFTRASDNGHIKSVPGTLNVTIAGKDYELAVFLDGDQLVLVFADETTGTESYAPGRFLKFPRPTSAGKVTLDFNYAFVPPCGFSNSFSCPIPPASNRIAAPIRAGERRSLWRDASTH